MIKRSGIVLVGLSLCLAAGCNRGAGNNGAKAANTATANAAAAAANSAAPAGQPRSQATLGLAPEGLQAIDTHSGSTRMIAFGTPIDDALRGLTGLIGAPANDATNSECGAGPTRIVQWNNGLMVLAQNNQFQGWMIDQPSITMMNGIGVGSTRAQLDQAFNPEVEQSTLGTEFSFGDVGEDGYATGGLLSAEGGDGRVTAMWSGLTCHFR